MCLISSKLDYCNGLLSGLPQKQIKCLHAMQNDAARTVTKCGKTDHDTPILTQLHWLPIQKRICHKILPVTYRSVQKNTPLSLSDLLHRLTLSRLLRSASRSLLHVPIPGILRHSNTVTEPSGMSHLPSGMSSPRASKRRTPFNLSEFF